MILPDFLVIGAGKSGTTSLNEYFKEHPQVFMCKRKEPNFFAFEMVNPADYELESSRAYFHQSVSKLDEYLSLFEGVKAGQLVGEVSNTYLSSELACQRIKHYIPDAKLIAILRHPAERLYSRYYHLVRINEVSVDWADLYDRESEWWKRQDLVDEGFYYAHLKPYYDNFPAENIKLVTYDDFTERTDETVRSIFRFLGIDDSVKIGTDVVYNKSGKVKNKALEKVVGNDSMIIGALRKISPGLHGWLKEHPLAKRILHSLRNKNVDKPELSATQSREIIDRIYREDLEQLTALTGLDLRSWLN